MRELTSLIRKSGEKARVCMDVDDVIVDMYALIIDEFNLRRGTNYTKEDMNTWDWSAIGASWKDIEPMYEHIWLERHREMKMMVDPQKLTVLNIEYCVNLVSAREGVTLPALRQYLEEHNINIAPLKLVPHGKDKADLDYHIYIDDKPALAETIGNCEGKVIFAVMTAPGRHVKESARILPVENVNVAIVIVLRAKSEVVHERLRAKLAG